MSRSFSFAAVVFVLFCLMVGNAPVSAMPDVGSPNATSGDYIERTEDLRVKVQGGFITVDRTWANSAWSINPRWNRLRLVYDPATDRIKSIERNGDVFEPAVNDPDIFRLGNHKFIEKNDTGFRWSNSVGEWIEYDAGGRVLGYGDRNAGRITLSYDAQDRLSGALDHRGEQVLWYDYDAEGRLIRIRDYSGRQVEYAYDGSGHINVVRDVRGNTWNYAFSGGLMISRIDPEGRTFTLSYNGQKRLIGIEDGIGAWRTYAYDYDKTRREFLFRTVDSTGVQVDAWHAKEGSLVRREINGISVLQYRTDGDWRIITDYSGVQTRLRYDDRQNLLETVFSDGTSISNRYDTRLSLKTQTTDERGVVTHYAYDTRGNRIRLTEAVGTSLERTTEYTYDDYGNVLTERRLADTKTAEAKTTYTYDLWGNRVTETGAEGQITIFDYDVMGNVVKRTDPRNQEWTFTYDAAGNLTSETNPLGKSELHAYDKVNNLISTTNRNNHTTLYAYDSRNNRISVTDPLGNTKYTAFDGEGRPTSRTDEMGRVTTLAYDNVRRLNLLIEPSGDRIDYTYAGPDEGVSFHLPKQIANPGYTETWAYDRRGRAIRMTKTLKEGEVLVTTRGYDRSGNFVRETDADNRSMLGSYDVLGRLVQITDPAGYSQRFAYDNRDNILEVHNKRGIVVRSYQFDRSNRLLNESWPGGARSFKHDKVGNLIEVQDANGHVTKNEYDSANRLLASRLFATSSSTVPDQTITYEYDSHGNRTAYADNSLTAGLAYDPNNRKQTEQIDFGGFQIGYQYEYAADGKKSALIYPDGMRVAYGYDNVGRLVTVDIPDVGDIQFPTHDRGLPTLLAYPGGTERQLTYDGLGRITAIQVTNVASTVLMNHQYIYNKVGNLVEKSTEHGDYSFSYDGLDQLISSVNPTLPDETYGYDPDGNRVSDANGRTWVYGDADQLISDGVRNYLHDASGNLISVEQGGATQFTYVYDFRNRLVEARDGTGTLLGHYTYDPDGRRIRSETDTVTYYLFADEGLIAELDASGNIVRRFGWKPDSSWSTDLLWSQSDSHTSFSLNDQIGTPWKQVGSHGGIEWETRYGAFGQSYVQRGNAMDNPWRFPGQYEVPELGLHYNYKRHYDPVVGRYQRHDPMGVRASINTYLYALNNPLVNIDTLGLFCQSGTGGAQVEACVNGAIGLAGGKVCSGVNCCTDLCDTQCCGYVKTCACATVGASSPVTGSAMAGIGSCAFGATFPKGLKACCFGCCVSMTSASCCSCEKPVQQCF